MYRASHSYPKWLSAQKDRDGDRAVLDIYRKKRQATVTLPAISTLFELWSKYRGLCLEVSTFNWIIIQAS